MKLILVISVTALLVATVTNTLKAQQTEPKVGVNTYKNSKIILPKPKRKQNKFQAKKLVEQFIDGIFVKRSIQQTFEDLTTFDSWDKTDTENIGQSSLLKKIPSQLGHSTNSRIAAAIFRAEYQRYYLEIGIYPITKSELAYPYSAPNYESLQASTLKFDSLKSAVTKKNNSLLPNFDFVSISKQEVEERLNEMEQNFDDIEKQIYELIDKDVYQTNIEIMKKTIMVKKIVKKNRTYYGVSFEGPDIGFILRIKNDEMKIIGFFDGV